MKYFVAFVVACVLIGLGVEMSKDTQGVPGLAQASTPAIVFSVIIACWGLWLLV